jgi:predicted restriction endonuclease
MAHLKARGMGGNPDGSRNTLDNTVWLCRYHHDVLDRRVTNTTKMEMRTLLTAYLECDPGRR